MFAAIDQAGVGELVRIAVVRAAGGNPFRLDSPRRGLLAVPPEADATAYKRAGYVTAMRAANAGAYVPW
jgi:hypothetical protein